MTDVIMRRVRKGNQSPSKHCPNCEAQAAEIEKCEGLCGMCCHSPQHFQLAVMVRSAATNGVILAMTKMTQKMLRCADFVLMKMPAKHWNKAHDPAPMAVRQFRLGHIRLGR